MPPFQVNINMETSHQIYKINDQWIDLFGEKKYGLLKAEASEIIGKHGKSSP